jgi:cellulose synthase/poly-beta-1,6-N-acetylglucosamine synthase-like glycosyltransferase
VLTRLLEVVAVGGPLAVVYSYAGYPLLLFMLAALGQGWRDAVFVVGKRERRQAGGDDLPTVAVVVSAYNEEVHIGARIANLLELDYPPERLRIYVGSDGSADRTGEIIRRCADPRVIALDFPRNRGKASVLNDLVARTSEAIIVFSDANTLFDRDAVRELISGFADPGVGCVSGELRLRAAAGANQDSLYWRVEQFLKFFEARLGALLGANGAIYAIRRELWKPLRPDTICDDFCVAMNVAAARYRISYAPRAWAEEDTPASIGEEYARRVRIGIGNFQALVRHPEYLWRTRWATRVAYLSHKVLRWIAPHLLVAALAASVVLAVHSRAWLWYAAGQTLAYAATALLWGASERGLRLPGVLRLAAFLFALNAAFVVASWRYATGGYRGSWKRTRR